MKTILVLLTILICLYAKETPKSSEQIVQTMIMEIGEPFTEEEKNQLVTELRKELLFMLEKDYSGVDITNLNHTNCSNLTKEMEIHLETLVNKYNLGTAKSQFIAHKFAILVADRIRKSSLRSLLKKEPGRRSVRIWFLEFYPANAFRFFYHVVGKCFGVQCMPTVYENSFQAILF